MRRSSLLLTLALLVAGCAAGVPRAGPAPAGTVRASPEAGALDPASAREAVIEGRDFRLEVARSPAEKARGLAGRSSLPEDAAMLFVYDEEDYRVFWMKDTLIPLDILFLDGQGVVVDVRTMEPQPDAPDVELRRYRSARPARYALEMNAGLADRLGIGVGAQLSFR